jgi:hypothetical protein
MSYQIRKSDGSLLIDLGVGVTDTSKTSLTLIGKNVSDFGKSQNENFVKLTENFASSNQPSNSLLGQLWYDTVDNQIAVKTPTGFVTIGPFPETTTPTLGSSNPSEVATTEFVHKILPKGSIILWYGALATVPAGWALCNGQSVGGITTPNLTDKFVMGAGNSYVPGVTGGSATISGVVAHSHTFSGTTNANSDDHTHGGFTTSAGQHRHGYPGDDQLSFASGVGGWAADSLGGFSYDARSVSGGGGQVWATTYAGSHNHTFQTGVQSASHNHQVSGATSTAGAATVNVLNPYYALAYIMKVV